MVSKSEYYRRRLKQKDPQGYAKYLEKQAVAAKRRRVKLREALSKPKPTKQSLALKEKQRKQARLRQKAYMERKKTQNAKQPCVKVKQEFELPQRPSSSKGASTSTNTETRRAYWCERKQSERLRSKTKATQQEKQSEHGRLRQKTYMEPQKTQNANQPCAEVKLEFELPQPPRSRKGASTSTNPETRRAYWRERKQAQKLRQKTKPVKKSPAQQEKQREQGRLRQKAYMERKKRLQVPRSRKAASTSTNTETRRAYWRERKQAERLRLVQSQPEKLRRIREEDRQRKRDKRARDKIKHILKPNTQTLSGFCSSCMTCLIANKPMCQSSCYAGGNFTAKRRKGQEKNEDEENNQAVPEVQTTTEVESSTTSPSLSLEAVPPDISGNTQIPEEIKVEQSVHGTSDWYLDKGSPETGEDKMADEDNEESLELVDDEAKKRVLAIGLVCLDIVSVLDHFPIEDTDTRVKDQLWNRGGNASNTSVVLSQLGVCTEYMGTLAKSVLTKLMVDDLTKYGVNMDHCLYHDDCDAPVSCVINNSSTGTRTILHGNRSLPEVMYKDFLLLDLKKYTWIHFEGRNITEVIQMINRVDMYNKELSESQRIKISLELEKPKLEICLEEVLARVDVVFVSKDFALSHGCKNGEDCVQLFSKKIKQGGQVVCAWGELGAWAIDEANGKVLHSAAYPPSIIKDTLGAGDTFNAGVIHYLSQDRSLLEAITHGCKVAGFKIGNQGFRIQHFTPS